MSVNEKIILTNRPEGMPTAEDFSIQEEQLPVPQAGEVLVRTLYVSVDPYMRGRMSSAKSYAAPYELGDVIKGGSIGQIMESTDPEWKQGDIVAGLWGWQRYAAAATDTLRRVDPELAPVSTALGVLGMTGLTAYFGLLDIGQPKEGETVVVSGAAGAVGMIVGQIAKIKGARVVGIAGSDEKNNYLVQELGFDAALNYRTESNLQSALEQACPNGVDVYFDNVGGEISDAVLSLLNKNARIPICGQIALYNLQQPDNGPRMQTQLLKNTALMKGFLVGDYAAEFGKALPELAGWLQSGQLQHAEHIVDGFEHTVEAFLGLFTGDNLGKQLVKVSEITE
ncbi:oxidoreductase, zinc-binding dehydrogenase family protein [Paenibacillus algicola]|uniref:Oxidoreductase, zinc-binding dehydrogenase family protein n=1 Tax=Paenibacillus algicola TaxID=2565926 RepID=A0A4P8XFJ2_9BACL|nr:NADP-dependent oxidoreductase [Paenibacillus algicola]QCT01197.1 oxidoreductase, zinc-binding dehydrogenase family protein [Paenibacillus algicola]